MWNSEFIQSNGIKLHYTRTGGAHPVMLLLHGFSDDGLCWSPIAEHLQSDWDVIMVDARGHGKSDGPVSGYSSDQHAADVAGLISALKLEKPIVTGHSMGAITALMLAALHPGLPRAVVLEDPPPFWSPPTALVGEATRRNGMSHWIVELKRKTREEMLAECKMASPTWPEAELGPWVDSKLRFSFNVLGDFAAPPTMLRGLLPSITCPALLITSENALGGITNPTQAADLQTLIPHLTIRNIQGAGHSIRREQPAAFLDTLATFVSRLA